MEKFIIGWDVDYGTDYEVIEAATKEDAKNIAYRRWREDAEKTADYFATEYSEELAEHYGIEDENNRT